MENSGFWYPHFDITKVENRNNVIHRNLSRYIYDSNNCPYFTNLAHSTILVYLVYQFYIFMDVNYTFQAQVHAPEVEFGPVFSQN